MKNFQSFITEENVNDGDIQIAVLTKVSSKEKEVVSNQIKEYADKNKIPVLVKAKIPVGTVKMHLVEWSGLKNNLSSKL